MAGDSKKRPPVGAEAGGDTDPALDVEVDDLAGTVVDDPSTAHQATEEELAAIQLLVQERLLGSTPIYTREQIAAKAGLPVELTSELWRLLGLPQPAEGEVAFTDEDLESLHQTKALIKAGLLSPGEQSALVRTWGRSFARLAEWQTTLLAQVAQERGGDLVAEAAAIGDEVIPLVEALQTYIWRRHLASAAGRFLDMGPGGDTQRMAVCFVDIVGYTARSRSISDAELVAWIEEFEATATSVVIDHGGRVIKTLGDAVLFVADDPVGAAEAALVLTEKGDDEDDPFPRVRAGISVGEVVLRLGDVFGPTVNIASRLTSAARPGTVLVDDGAVEALEGGYSMQRLRRSSVKSYSHLHLWSLRRSAAI